MAVAAAARGGDLLNLVLDRVVTLNGAVLVPSVERRVPVNVGCIPDGNAADVVDGDGELLGAGYVSVILEVYGDPFRGVEGCRRRDPVREAGRDGDRYVGDVDVHLRADVSLGLDRLNLSGTGVSIPLDSVSRNG